jgi:hypothetical protein
VAFRLDRNATEGVPYSANAVFLVLDAIAGYPSILDPRSSIGRRVVWHASYSTTWG